VKGGFHFYRGSGVAAARYFDEGHRGAEAYYTEQARVAVAIDTWCAGEKVGTTTLAEPGDLVKWVEGMDPLTGEVKGIIRSGGPERQPLRFVEVAVNNPKSLSIVASQNPVVAEALDRTLARQADEVARYLSAVAVTRVGPKGAQREVGGLRVETARVTHLTSREGDPHRHVHLMLNTRVMAPDGSWRGLHSAALRQHLGAIHERGARVLLTDVELRRTLASEGYTLGQDGEIDQARDAVPLLSKRTTQVAEHRAAIEASWRAEHPDRQPSQRVINGWDQAAWEETRQPKPVQRETPAELNARLRVELAQAGFDFGPDARTPVVIEEVTVAEIDRVLVAETVVATLSGQKSAWSKADLSAEVERAVLATGVTGLGEPVGELVEDVEARALAQCRSVLDPARHTPTAMSKHLTSDQVVVADWALNTGLAGLAGGEGGRDHDAFALAQSRGLGAGQAEAAAVVAGSRRLEVVIGPAGTGKTTLLAVARDRLVEQGRELTVVAPTRKGAMVAAKELGTEGSSLSKLLYAHGWRWDAVGRWSRLDPGELDPKNGRPFEPRSTLGNRSVVVVDEAALMTVDQAVALIDLAAETGAAVRLVGDPRQLGAVGRGGVMETASRWADDPVTLDEVHRFVQVTTDEAGLPVTAPDRTYAELTLAIREGDDPFAVADRMVERGMVIVHHTDDEATAALADEAALAAEQPGTLAVTVATNAEALAVNEAVRARRVLVGTVDDRQIAAGMDGVRIGAGDRIVTRKNDPDLGVANREAWTVEEIRRSAVIATDGGRRVTLDSGYVAQSVQLGYATTDYGNQGITADRSIASVRGNTTAGGLYVAATRGRFENTLHVVAADLDDARDQLVAALGRDRADRGLDAARQRAEHQATPVPALAPPAIRQPIDPATWHSAAELDRRARGIETRLRNGLYGFPIVPVMDRSTSERANAEDRRAAADARERATGHRAALAQMAADRVELATTARSDYFAARDAARIIEAGPGRLGRRADQLRAAEDFRSQAAERWDDHQLPRSGWSDDSVQRSAANAVDRRLRPLVVHHEIERAHEEETAAGLDRQVADRDAAQQRAQVLNATVAPRRQALIAEADREREVLAHDRAERDERTHDMTPEEIDAADADREDYLWTEHGVDVTASAPAVSTVNEWGLPEGISPDDFDIEGPDFGL
jgi:exodeoxyribonuclease V alpha subunit